MSEEIDNWTKTLLEAAIDKATGYKPGDEDRVFSDSEQDDKLGPKGPSGTPGDLGRQEDETKLAADETKVAEAKENAATVKENAAPVKKKSDWVKEAYECFIKNAVDLEPTDPAGAVWEYFKKNATDELKAKVEQEGKTGASCWKFIEAVAREALGGRSGHIDPVAIYAIAMHYFQDVPKDWDRVEKSSAARPSGVKKPKGGKFKGEPPKKTDLKGGKHKTSAKVKEEKPKPKPKAKKRGGEQGFFFDLMETPTVGPDGKHGVASDAALDGEGAGNAE